MAVGLSDGTSYADSADWFAASVGSVKSGNIEDRRKEHFNSFPQEPQMQNVFEMGDGTLTALNADSDFATKPDDHPTELGIGAGINDIRMPLQASTELTGALKSSGSTGIPDKPFETKLDPESEPKFQEWKSLHAPKDSGEDYDLRGAFAAGITPDPTTGHWPDTWKKPNHPTFSDQSMYAKDAPDKAGTWDGETYIPPKRSIIGQLTGSDGGERFQTWPERLARSAFTLPGDVLSGKVQPGSIQEIERAADLASVMVGGPAPVAKGMADGTLGSFAGVKSTGLRGINGKGGDPVLKGKLYEAQTMELDAMHPDDIWNKTGFFRGADQRWRYEIPDKDAKLKPEAFDTILENGPTEADKKAMSGWINLDNWTPQGDKIVPKNSKYIPSKSGAMADYLFDKRIPLTLDKVLDHPELFKAYPELGTMKVEPLPAYLEKTGVQGQVSGDTIYLAPGHPEFVRSVLLHEVQHGIQRHEGFAYGGNQEQFLPKELPQAEKEFLSLQSKEEPKIAKVLERTGFSIKQFKLAVKAEQSGIMPPAYAERVQFLKEEHPTEYRKLSSIVKSETLLKQAKEEAFTKYTRLMGEVESRNVQARRNMTDFMRESLPPNRTEEIPRHLQINPNDKSSAAMSNISELSLTRTPKSIYERLTQPETHSFEFNNGDKVGTLTIEERQGGKELNIKNMGGSDVSSISPNDIGSSDIRSLLRSIKKEFPNAEKLVGYRLSGGRVKAGKAGRAEIPLK